MSFMNGVWRLLGAEIDDVDNDNIVEYPGQEPDAAKLQPRQAPPPAATPAETLIAMPEPPQATVTVVRPELDEQGEYMYSVRGYRDVLRRRRPLIVDLNPLAAIDEVEALRVIDCLLGMALAVDGAVHEITKNIFIITPSNVELEGDPIRQVEIQ